MLWLKDQAPHASPRGAFSEVDPHEYGGLRQGNIALIHSAPTGESWVETVIARSDATKQSILALPPDGLLRFARNDGRSPQYPLGAFFIASSCSGLAVPWNFDFQVS